MNANISDDQNLVYVDLQLLTFENELIKTQRVNVSGTSINFGSTFPIDQPLLSGGQYFFALRAFDGENRSSAFKEILISPIPREIDQFIAITSSNNNVQIQTSVDLTSWTNQIIRFLDYNGAAFNYRENILGIVGGEIGDAEFYDSEEFILIQSYNGFGTPSEPYFLGVEYSYIGEHFTLLQNEPRTRVLDKIAKPLVAAELMMGFLPAKAFDFGDRYFVLEKRIINDQRFLNLYSFAGVRLKSFAVSGPVIKVFEKDVDKFFVWIDEAEGASLYELDLQTELFAPIYQRPGESLNDVFEMSPGIFIISTDQGMYRYTFSNGGTNPLNNQYGPSRLIYDEVNGFIYGVEGQSLRRFSPGAQLIETIDFNQELVFFGIDYNR